MIVWLPLSTASSTRAPRSLSNEEWLAQPSRLFAQRRLRVEAIELAEPDRVWMLGRKPRRIDILTGIRGVSFEAAAQHSVNVELDGHTRAR